MTDKRTFVLIAEDAPLLAQPAAVTYCRSTPVPPPG